MFASLLIANRGEIACRVIRTARSLGIRTVAVVSAADREALHARLADEVREIGPAPAAESYLRQEAILAAARQTGAEAIHPGYGFLSENADFAEACAAAGIVFVGPPPSAIRAMGRKDEAKALMEKAGVPVVPGYHGARQEPDFLREKAYEIGYPVLVKAVAGGGGKGMRRVDRALDFDAALAAARREAAGAFADERVLIEKFVTAPRHVEVQIFGDRQGQIVHLFERDCSLQRRHQKVIEEAPAPGMTDGLRRRMGEAAVRAGQAVGYVGAGTVEFVADGSSPLVDETEFHFLEMNTRLQVEHPVTEAVTGLDLVEWQLRVAAGEPLPLGQADITLAGAAVEARLYAEDPSAGFLPSTGRVELLRLPEGEGIRVDAGVAEGSEVTVHYDPLIAKIIASGRDRDEALDRLGRALAQTGVAGPRTNLPVLADLVRDDEFRAGRFDTGLIERRLPGLGQPPATAVADALAAAATHLLQAEANVMEARRLARSEEPFSPWAARDGFGGPEPRRHGVELAIEGERHTVEVEWSAEGPVAVGSGAAGPARVVDSADGVLVLLGGHQFRVERRRFDSVEEMTAEGDATLRAPMHGRLVALMTEPGREVAAGEQLAVVEAMKMEHPLAAPVAGRVADVLAAIGDRVEQGQPIILISAGEGS